MKRAGWLLLLAACGGGAETAVRVRVDFAQSMPVKQLRFSGRASETLVFGPEVRPDRAATVLESGGELLVLVPDRLDAQELECSVDGLDGARVVASGAGAVRVQRGHEVECLAVLRTTAACGGCVDAMGKCRPGSDDEQCGRAGAACMKCEGELNHCEGGRCVD